MPKQITVARELRPNLRHDLPGLPAKPFLTALHESKTTISSLDLFKLRGMYAIDIPTARRLFGAPDCYFKGEWRYAVYYFVATNGIDRQEFTLWADPKTAGKGTAIEFITTTTPKLVIEIAQWAHKLGTSNKPPTKKK